MRQRETWKKTIVMKTMDNYSRRSQSHKSSYLSRRQTPVVYTWKASSFDVHSTTSTPPEGLYLRVTPELYAHTPFIKPMYS